MVRKLSDERRKAFLSSALKLFVANGVQHTSTAEIAREAGTAAGTLFLYFPTKQALIDELVLQISREVTQLINSVLVPSLDARDSFFAIWNGSIRWFIGHMQAYQYVQQVRDSGLLGEVVAQETEKLFVFYYNAIQKGLNEGCIKTYPIELIGGILYQGIVAVMNLIIRQPDPVKREEYIGLGFELFWDGIKIDN